MKASKKVLASLLLMVILITQLTPSIFVRAEEKEVQKYKLSFELERDASTLNEIYQKHDDGDESEKTDENSSDEAKPVDEANSVEEANPADEAIQ